jgi:hypothetical protein
MRLIVSICSLLLTSAAIAAEQVALTIEPTTNHFLIEGESQRRWGVMGAWPNLLRIEPTNEHGVGWSDLFPDRVIVQRVSLPSNYVYRAQVDFYACIRNVSTNELRFFEEWNSCGYYNLKIVCDDGNREYWVVKQPGCWYRNFPSSTAVQPGESIRIPVAFDPIFWDGVSRVEADKKVKWMRVVYEQNCLPTNNPPFMTEKHWNGMATSPGYKIGQIMPRFRSPSDEKEYRELEPTAAASPPLGR